MPVRNGRNRKNGTIAHEIAAMRLFSVKSFLKCDNFLSKISKMRQKSRNFRHGARQARRMAKHKNKAIA
jgi:hypothetical protein